MTTSWLREHTRILQRAIEWDRVGRPENRLLTGPDVEKARAWLNRRPKGAPEPTPLHSEYIHVAEQHQANVLSAERQRLEEVELLKSKLQSKRTKIGTCVFISYRRADAQVYAGRISDWLDQGALRRKLFIDVDTIQKGRDFTEILDDHLARCGVMLVLIGEKWLESTGASGGRRLDDPNDFVRREISAALKRDIAVIPVLLDGALMPNADQLPNDIKPLVKRQSVSINHANFARDIRELRGIVQSDLKISHTKNIATGAALLLIIVLIAIVTSFPSVRASILDWLTTH